MLNLNEHYTYGIYRRKGLYVCYIDQTVDNNSGFSLILDHVCYIATTELVTQFC